MQAIQNLKLYRYNAKYKMQYVSLGILLLAAVISSMRELVSTESFSMFSYFFITYPALSIIQQCQLLAVSGYVSTSSKLYKSMTLGCAELILIVEGLLYTIFITAKYFLLLNTGRSTQSVMYGVPIFLIMLFGICFYSCVYFKKPIVALIVYALTFGAFFAFIGSRSTEGSQGYENFIQPFLQTFHLQPTVIIFGGYIGIVICILIYILIIHLLRRLPYSDRVIEQVLRNTK